MNLKELKMKTEDELKKLLAESRETLRDLRFKVHRGDEKKVHRVKEVKKIIAQVLTILNK